MNTFFKTIDRFLYLISRKKYFIYLLSFLFFVIFGFAFYLIYLDSIAIKDQINTDFNEQQLILARQSSAQVDLFLTNLEIQLKNLKWFCSKKSYGIRAEALRAFFEQNNNMGILDIGYFELVKTQNIIQISYGNNIYFHEEGIPDLNLEQIIKQAQVGIHNSSDTLKLSYPEVVRDSKNGVYITSTIINSIYQENESVGYLVTRLDLSVLMKRIVGNVRSGRTGYAWVIDDKGIALYHPEKDFIGRNIFEARQEKKPYVNFSQINSIMKERMMRGEEGTATYESWWHRELKGQITKLIAFTPVRNTFLPENKIWSIAVVAPTSEVAEAVDKAYFRHMAAEAFIIAGMFLFAVLMLAYQRRISTSLKERVSEQEEYISSILENSMDAIIFSDKDNLIQTWNKGAEKIFEFNSNEMKGKSFHSLIPPEQDAEQELSHINEIVNKTGYITNYLAQRITKSGRRIQVNISKTLISSIKGEILGYAIIVRDETEKQELEQRIYNTEKLASIGTLAAGVAHEINNPLAVILGYTDLLTEKFSKGSQEYIDLKLIESNANTAKKIVENLLGFARITEGLDDNIDVKLSISTVVGIVRNTLFTKKIEIDVNIPDGLPHVKGDVREYQQVIFNLINNSVAAMKDMGKGEISIIASKKGNMIVVEIRDNGSGIPNKFKQRIFDPFFTTKKVGEGTGLGLSLCYGIVTKFGGKMSFKSTSRDDSPNEIPGTTFIVEMPIIEHSSM